MFASSLSYVGPNSTAFKGNAETANYQGFSQLADKALPQDKPNGRVSNVASAYLPTNQDKNTATIYELKKGDLPKLNKLLAEWEGRVVSIYDDYFVADVEGLTGEGVEGISEQAIIPIADIQDQDTTLFRVGAFFRLCINYQMIPGKRRVRVTTVIFRRLPAYSASELNAADDRARHLYQRLHVE